jgi:hypothetical protein
VNAQTTSAPRWPAVTFLIAGLIVAASIAALAAFGGRSVSGAPLPSGAPSTPPVATPSTPVATPAPTDGGPIRIDIETINGADVHVDIVDETGTVRGGRSGPAGEGASVAPYTLAVANVGASTLKLTWVDYPIDNALQLHVMPNDGVIHLVLIQPEPTGPTDSMVTDRVLFVEFDRPISADDVVATLQDGLDTPGWAGYDG